MSTTDQVLWTGFTFSVLTLPTMMYCMRLTVVRMTTMSLPAAAALTNAAQSMLAAWAYPESSAAGPATPGA
jgi:hypothetical protein